MAHYKPYEKDYREKRRLQLGDTYGNKSYPSSPGRTYAGHIFRNCDFSSKTHDLQSIPGLTQDIGNSLFSQSVTSDYQTLHESGYQNHHFGDTSSYGCFKGASNVSMMDLSYDDQKSNINGSELSFSIDKLLKSPDVINQENKIHDEQKFLYPIEENTGKSKPTNQRVNLIISNLDPTLKPKELEQRLYNMLPKHLKVLSLTVRVQSEGFPTAFVCVNGQNDAQFMISQLHRRKLGYKKILISYAQSNSADYEELRAMIVEQLQDIPGKSMPLFKFIDLLESRYNCTTSVSELKKLKDVCTITEDLGFRNISLNQGTENSSPTSHGKTVSQYCTIHCPLGTAQNWGWNESNPMQSLCINLPLKVFTNKLMALLKIHRGTMHLSSFQYCYEQEFHEPLPLIYYGVPLEHLVTCLNNVEITVIGVNKNVKLICYSENTKEKTEEDAVYKFVPPAIVSSTTLLCRELVDLLKNQERCQLLMSKFIPAYHSRFGKQCRVADYGHTKLSDLFESIPHVIQILNDGTRRTITLSHSAQMRRFTSDFLRVLKSQLSKQISLKDFPVAYLNVFSKPFSPVDYGLCSIEDLVEQIPENTVVVSEDSTGNLIVSLPKKQQTLEEIVLTQQFATEVIDLLRHVPYHTMIFDKFVPAYHHHFGYQCKVSTYGFTKLIELFEAIPDTVKIEESFDGRRTISLMPKHALKLLALQIVDLIKSFSSKSLLWVDLQKAYLKKYRHPLMPERYECYSVSEVIEKISDYVQVRNSDAGLLLVAVDVDRDPSVLITKCWTLLLKRPHGMDLTTFSHYYQSKYGCCFAFEAILKIDEVLNVSIVDNYVSLTKLYVLAAELYEAIQKKGGKICYSNLEKCYRECFGAQLNLKLYKIYCLEDFLKHFNLMFLISGPENKRVIRINRNLLDPCASGTEKNNTVKSALDSSQLPLDKLTNEHQNTSPPNPENSESVSAKKWSPSNLLERAKNLQLNLSNVIDSVPMVDPYSLVRSDRETISTGQWNPLPMLSLPDPTQLPMPDKLIEA